MTDLGDYGLLFRNCWDLALLLRKLGLTSTIGDFTVVYSVPWPLNGSEAEGDLCYVTNLLAFMCNSCYSYANKVVNIIYTFETGSFVTKRSTLASPPVNDQESEHTTVIWLLLVLSHVTRRPFWWTKFTKKIFAQFEWIRFFIVYRDGRQHRLLVSFVDWRYDRSF